MISIVFKKMEQHSGDFSESFKRLNTGESLPGQDSTRAGTTEVTSAGGATTTAQGSEARSSSAGVRPQRPVGQPALREGAD